MTTEVILRFSPRTELHALENLAGFVAMARDELTIFGNALDWDADVWDVSSSVHASGLGRVRISFTGLPDDSGLVTPMAGGIREFAKAYIRYQQGLTKRRGQQQRLAAFRVLDAAAALPRLEDVTRLGPAQFDLAVERAREHYSAESAYRIASNLAAIARFVSEKSLVQIPFQWTHSVPRERNPDRLTKEFQARRNDKLPSERALQAIAYAFRAADNPSDRIAASAAALMCCAPVRVGELLRMRAHCEVVKARRNGAEAFGLRWWAEKGPEPEVRWIVPVMVDVAREALEVIQALTSDARRMSAWYACHPEELHLPEGFQHLRQLGIVPIAAADELLGLDSRSWAERRGLRGTSLGSAEGFEFGAFERAVLAELPSGFPLVETATRLAFEDALFVVRRNEFRTDRGSYLCMMDRVTQRQIHDCLGGRIEHGAASLFSRLGLVDEDGAHLKITSHQFRHYINTVSQSSGLSQLDIALWSGRSSVAQNRAYDHQTADEIIEDVREALGVESESLCAVAPVDLRAPITREELQKLGAPTAHFTEFGVCVHDFTMEPCQLHRDCLHCDEHVCVKGDVERTRRVAALLADTRNEIAKTEVAEGAGFAGADRWLEHHRRSATRYGELYDILTDPSIPDGTIVRCAPSGAKLLTQSGGRPALPGSDRRG